MTAATASRARPAPPPRARPPEFRYHLLRAATERFGRGLPALDADEHDQAEAQAVRTFALEERVLSSAEALDVVIPEAQLTAAVATIAGRYEDHATFVGDLAANGLDENLLRRALQRELTFDAVLRRVGARHVPVDETDERLFYELHRERFDTPERRTAWHILVTINDDYPENHRDTARARLEALAAGLTAPNAGEPAAGKPADGDGLAGASLAERFAAAARRHSECPTAVEGGSLGRVSPGQLFPALDQVLFALPAGGMSGIVESPLGFHLLLCEAIEPAQHHDFAAVRERLHAALVERRRRECQREWLAGLGA